MGGNKEPLPGLFNWPITGCRTLAPGPARWPGSRSSSPHLLPQHTWHPSTISSSCEGWVVEMLSPGLVEAAPYPAASNLCRRCHGVGVGLLELLLQPVHVCDFFLFQNHLNVFIFLFSFGNQARQTFFIINLMQLLTNKSWKRDLVFGSCTSYIDLHVGQIIKCKKKTRVGKRSNEGSLESKTASLVRADLGVGECGWYF